MIGDAIDTLVVIACIIILAVEKLGRIVMDIRKAGKTTLNHDIRKTTDDAVMIEVAGSDVWVPRSVCLDGRHLEEGDEDLCVENWWLRKNGLT